MRASNVKNKPLWVFKSVSDEDRSYRSIESYDDELGTRYIYDKFVPNHKRVQEGDWVIIIDKEFVLGFARIQKITSEHSMKSRRRCPSCSETTFEARKTKTPLYRCNKGHEFDLFIEESVPSINYTSSYGNSFVPAGQVFPISALKPFYVNRYNRNMSIQSLSSDFFIHYFKSIPGKLSSEIAIQEDEMDANIVIDNDDYVPNDKDERDLIDKSERERKGQELFKNKLKTKYGNKCMISGCALPSLLQAAHINPYRGIKDNHPSNGLILRSDIHTLFDLNLIAINPITLKIFVAPSARENGYGEYHNILLKECSEKNRPSLEALKLRWMNFIDSED